MTISIAELPAITKEDIDRQSTMLQKMQDLAKQVKSANANVSGINSVIYNPPWIITTDNTGPIPSLQGPVTYGAAGSSSGSGIIGNGTYTIGYPDSSGTLTWAPMTASSTASTSSFSNLSVAGNASVGQTLTVENIIVNGTITSAYEPGDIIKMSAYNASDLSMDSISINSYSYTEIGSTTFTPKSSNSYLVFEFNVSYYIDSLTVANDDFYSQITVDGSEIVFSRQIYEIGQSGGTRSGVLFPLLGRYTNSSTSSKTISIKAKRGNTDDNLIIVANSVSGFLRVTEVAR
jgi:hypothetical protein